MEYLYIDIHTGAYWTSTRNGKTNPEDCEENGWEKPVFRVAVLSCEKEETSRVVLRFYESWSRPQFSYAELGWLFVSGKYGDRFRAVGWAYAGFYNPIHTNYRPIARFFIEPLDGNRMPEPGEMLDIIPEGANLERFL